MTKAQNLILCLLCIPLTACMTPTHPSAADSAATLAQNRRSELQHELLSVDAQLATIDGMVAGADARVQSYQSMDVAGKETMISGVEAERLNYHSQRQALVGRKRNIELEMISLSK